MLLDLGLEVRRRDVLAARGDDDVLLAAGDLDEAVGVDLAEVAGVQPAVDDRLAGRLLVLVIALEYVRAPDEDLAVVRDPHLATGKRLADRADPEVLGGRDRRRGRGLGHAPALENEDAGRVEEAEDLGVDRRCPRDRQPDLAAEKVADLREHLLVGELVLLAQQEPRLAAGALGLAHLLADSDGPVEDQLLEAALLLHRGGGGGVDLLEDPRHGGEVGRLHLGEVGDDLERVALPVGERGAQVEAAELDQQRERVREREVEVGELAFLDHALRVHHVEHRAVVPVRDHAALGRPRGARCVDEGADVLGGDRAPALLPLGGVASLAAAGDLLHRGRVLAAACHPDHLLELGQALADGADLLELLVVLDDDDARVRVLEDVLALFRRVGLVDRDHGRPGGERREIEVGPFGPCVGEDRDLVALLDPHLDQPEGERAHGVPDLVEAARGPGTGLVLVHDGGAVAVLLGGPRQEVGDGHRPGARRSCRRMWRRRLLHR